MLSAPQIPFSSGLSALPTIQGSPNLSNGGDSRLPRQTTSEARTSSVPETKVGLDSFQRAANVTLAAVRVGRAPQAPRFSSRTFPESSSVHGGARLGVSGVLAEARAELRKDGQKKINSLTNSQMGSSHSTSVGRTPEDRFANLMSRSSSKSSIHSLRAELDGLPIVPTSPRSRALSTSRTNHSLDNKNLRSPRGTGSSSLRASSSLPTVGGGGGVLSHTSSSAVMRRGTSHVPSTTSTMHSTLRPAKRPSVVSHSGALDVLQRAEQSLKQIGVDLSDVPTLPRSRAPKLPFDLDDD